MGSGLRGRDVPGMRTTSKCNGLLADSVFDCLLQRIIVVLDPFVPTMPITGHNQHDRTIDFALDFFEGDTKSRSSEAKGGSSPGFVK